MGDVKVLLKGVLCRFRITGRAGLVVNKMRLEATRHWTKSECKKERNVNELLYTILQQFPQRNAGNSSKLGIVEHRESRSK